MQNTPLQIGCYGVEPGLVLNAFEDECVGNLPTARKGIIVTKVEDDRVLVREWKVRFHFEGEHALEHFEEAKHNQQFDFSFSDERELEENESLDGSDPMLRKQLCRKLNLHRERISLFNGILTS